MKATWAFVLTFYSVLGPTSANDYDVQISGFEIQDNTTWVNWSGPASEVKDELLGQWKDLKDDLDAQWIQISGDSGKTVEKISQDTQDSLSQIQNWFRDNLPLILGSVIGILCGLFLCFCVCLCFCPSLLCYSCRCCCWRPQGYSLTPAAGGTHV